MPSFDPFGLKKETALEAADDAPEPASAPPSGPQNLKTAKRVLTALLALNAAFLLVCAGGLAARVRRLAKQPAPAPAPAPKPQPVKAPEAPTKPTVPPALEKPEPAASAKPAPAPAKPAPAPAPAPAKPAPAPAPAKPAPAPAPAKPASAPAPAKPAPAPAPAKPAPAPVPAKPAPAPAAAPAPAPAKPSTTRKVEFTHTDPSAKDAHLLGAFLVKTKGRTPMTRYSTGEWRITVTLVSGTTYSYRIETVDAQGKAHSTKKQAVFVAP